MKARVLAKQVEYPRNLPSSSVQAFLMGVENAGDVKSGSFDGLMEETKLAYTKTIGENLKTKKTQEGLLTALMTEIEKLMDSADAGIPQRVDVPKNLPKSPRQAYVFGVEEAKKGAGVSDGMKDTYRQAVVTAFENVVGEFVKTKKTQTAIITALINQLK